MGYMGFASFNISESYVDDRVLIGRFSCRTGLANVFKVKEIQ